MNKQLKYSLFIILFLCFCFPIINQKLDSINVLALKGYFTEPVDSALTLSNWLNGTYQKQKEERLKFKLKLRPFFIRFNNQLRKSLFSEDVISLAVITGKNGYLFEKGYVDSYLGLDFMGEDVIREKLKKLKFIKDTLAKKNTKILFLMAAGKGLFMPENLPESCDIENRKTTNYEIFIKYLKQFEIPLLDFNQYFLEIKDTISYPLYSKGGTHWSDYGSFIAFDTLISYLEVFIGKDMPDYIYSRLETTVEPRKTDHDIGEAANLFWYSYSDTLAYLTMVTTPDSSKYKPNVMIIADSYYWTWIANGIPEAYFSKDNSFWYYFKEIHSNEEGKPFLVEDIEDYYYEFESRDIIMIMITEGNLKQFGWGFVEKVYEMYMIEKNNDI